MGTLRPLGPTDLQSKSLRRRNNYFFFFANLEARSASMIRFSSSERSGLFPLPGLGLGGLDLFLLPPAPLLLGLVRPLPLPLPLLL